MPLVSVRLRLVLPLLAVLALPVSLSAQETQLFTWTGRVDREVSLSIRGRNVSSNAARGEDYRGRFNITGELPRMDGTVRVAVNSGRGEISVVQQPSASNNYQAVIRVVDRSSGADRYQVTALFTPANARGGWNRRNGTGADSSAGGVSGTYGNNNGMNDDNGRGRGRNRTVVLHWSGMVDANAEVRWQGGSVRQRALDGASLRNVRSSVSGNVNNGRNRRDDQATVSVREGRGQVTVVQQPSQQNGYTTIVRINDPQGGYGRYSFDVTLQ